MTLRALVVCPGRGSYGPAELGSIARLPDPGGLVARADALLASWGATPVTELDAAARFEPGVHAYGGPASVLTFVATALDLALLDPEKVRVVAVTGNSMGWYTALYAAGALDFEAALKLVHTMGSLQDLGAGSQTLFLVVDDEWRVDPVLASHVDDLLAATGARWSIRLGGIAVLAGSDEQLDALEAGLGERTLGGRRYPRRLAQHAAFHTPLMERFGAEGRARLTDLPWRAPSRPLIDGRGAQHRPRWADPSALAAYTLGAQIVEPFDLTAAVRVGLREVAPDVVVLAGPGQSLGAPVAQVLVAEGWRGVRSKADFLAAQAGHPPAVAAMARADQRALVSSS